MDDIGLRVLRVLAENPRGAIIRDEDEKYALTCMALQYDPPVSDVYEMPDGSLTGTLTEWGRRALAKCADEQNAGVEK